MSLPVPKLDDIDFEQLVEFARARIPRYAPHWTDHNVHDPGMTLLDLISWLVDQQIYQVGFISDQHITAFAALLGVRKALAKPAEGLIWPRQQAHNPMGTSGVNLNRYNKVTCIEQPEVTFELVHDMYLTPANIADQEAKDTRRRFQLTSKIRQCAALPIQESASHPDCVELVFDRPLVEDTSDGIPEFAVSIGVQPEAQSPCHHNDARFGRLVVDYRIDVTNESAWRRLKIVHDGTDAFSHAGVVLLDVPAYRNPQQEKIPSRLRFRVQHRASPLPIKIIRMTPNVVPITQWHTIAEHVLGVSNGLPDQALQVVNRELSQGINGLSDLDYIKIRTNENGQWLAWRRVDDLSQAGPQDNVFKLHQDKNEIVFGNGLNGRIPPRNIQIIRDKFKLSMGVMGNLRAGLHWVVQGVSYQSGDSFGDNVAAIQGGSDAQNIDELRALARQRALDREVLLTDDELVQATLQLHGLDVERAEVKVGFHPAMPKRQLPGIRTLIVTPKRGKEVSPLNPVKPVYLRAVYDALIKQRVIGERLLIIGSKRIPVSVNATITVVDGADLSAVKREALDILNARLSDIPAIEGIAPWPVGRAVRKYEIKDLLAGISNVIAIPDCLLAQSNGKLREVITLQPDEIAIGYKHKLVINTQREKR